MRPLTALLVLLAPAVAFAQSPAEKAATLKFISSLYDPATGGYKITPDGKPSLRACNGAAKAVKYLGGELPDRAKTAAFVMSCYDPATGTFAEPGGKPDVAVTSVGVIAAVELGVPKEKFARAMDYLKANAKTFEDVRIAAAAVEAWGVKDCPFDFEPWVKAADEVLGQKVTNPRDQGSAAALRLRLGRDIPQPRRNETLLLLGLGQHDDGGWSKPGAASELETTYRVMRAYHLFQEGPKDPAKLRDFLAKCRNADGGYGVKPGEVSSMSGVYYAVTIGHWLDDLGKK
jgi:hypothetical protein